MVVTVSILIIQQCPDQTDSRNSKNTEEALLLCLLNDSQYTRRLGEARFFISKRSGRKPRSEAQIKADWFKRFQCKMMYLDAFMQKVKK